MNQYPLAGLQSPKVTQGAVGRQIGHGQSGGFFKAQIVRLVRHEAGWRSGVRAETARCNGDDRIAHFELGKPRSDRRDPPRAFKPKRIPGQGLPQAGGIDHAHCFDNVFEIQSRCADFDGDVTRSGFGDCDVFKAQMFERSRRGERQTERPFFGRLRQRERLQAMHVPVLVAQGDFGLVGTGQYLAGKDVRIDFFPYID